MAEAIRDQNHVTNMLMESSSTPGLTLNVKGDQTTGRLLTDNGGGGTGTVTSVSVVTANGLAGSVATATTTPAITLSTTVNGLVKANGTAFSAAVAGTDYANLSFTTIAVSGQTDVVADSASDTLTLVAGTNVTITTNAAGDAITINASAGSSGITVGTTTITSGTNTRVLYNNSGVVGEYVISGTGNVAMTTSPVFTTPNIGAATATTVNGLTITSSTGTLTITNAKTLSVTNSITLSGTDSTVMTFPTTTATIARTDAAQTFTGTQTFSGTVALGTNSITMTGSIAATGARVTKGWFTDVESTNMYTVGGTSLTTVAQTFQNKTITNSNNVLGGVTMTLGSDASFDMYYRNGSGILTRLGNGTTGQVLTATSAAAPSWAAASGGTTPTSGVGSMPTTSSTQTVTHGLGKTPTFIELFCVGNLSSSTNSSTYSYSVGTWSAAGEKVIYNMGGVNVNSAPQTSTGFSGLGASPTTPASNNSTANIGSVGATTFDITWGLSGTVGASDVKYLWRCQ